MKHLILTIMSGCVAMSLNAADPFADIESQVVANNTDLASLAGANEADNLAAASENNLSDPEIEFEHLWGKGSVKWGAGISQSFEWPGLNNARSKANKAGAEARRLMFESERADLVYKSRRLMLEIVGIRQQMQFADSMISNLEHLLATTQLAMERGQATRLDVSKARFALLSIKQEREGYTDMLQDSRSQLVALNGGKNIDISGLDSYPQ
ncbi:MAG: TolC family protein, partial [Muribaculaceae bacterium]|nr:TolC family protein [Muribaculaceae bacterium]